MQSDSNILQIDNLSKYFGGLAAVSDCSLKIKRGSITGIIGPNGSGKTTLFNLIAGNLKTSKGTVLFNNQDITDVPSYELFSKGLLRTFQIAHEFTNLTVLENLMMVPGNQSGENIVNALLKPGLVKKEEEQVKQKAYEVIDFLNLKHLANELAGNLSGGQKKLLELGRTMMVDAKAKPEPESLPPARIGGCLIATATYGSELAPQVQLLREIRDNTVLQTQSGTSFMTAFNQFYYSFSPAIADYERENTVFKETVKLTLTPLLASLTLLQYVDIDSESEMLGYGIGIILLNIGMYFVAPALLITKIRSFYKLQ